MRADVKKIVCAISGGVDSCVAALLLKKKGYEVLGVFMRNWDVADETGFCQADQDKEDAEYACRKIGIKLVEVNFVKEYWNNVFSSLLWDYENGLTPNPDVLCNKTIKFGAFWKYAMHQLNADAVATGHYARTTLNEDEHTSFGAKGAGLFKAVDSTKDQTFFLSQIRPEVLQYCIFPVGGLKKSIVKKIALEAGLSRIAKKRESTGICFIGRRNFQNFIKDYIEPTPGNFVCVESGSIVGQHDGIHCWTIGQRCHIPGMHSAYFVAEKNVETQEILVAPGSDHPALYHLTLLTEAPHWITSIPPKVNDIRGFECDFRFQHLHILIRCLLFQGQTGMLEIYLEKPLKALTPGQYAVFYKGEECLGSARILGHGPLSLIHI